MSSKITLDEYLAEIDGLIEVSAPRSALLTEEQYVCLKTAREAANPVTWTKLTKWWNKKDWGIVKMNTLKNRYHLYKSEHELS